MIRNSPFSERQGSYSRFRYDFWSRAPGEVPEVVYLDVYRKAFFEAMPDNEKDSVLFIDNLNARAFLEEVTPADIANSKNCDWIYNEHK